MSDVYAVVMKVPLDLDTSREHRKSVIEQYVVPEYQELPGFQFASWMNDGKGTGLCIVDFQSEVHPRAAVPALTGHGGPEVIEWTFTPWRLRLRCDRSGVLKGSPTTRHLGSRARIRRGPRPVEHRGPSR